MRERSEKGERERRRGMKEERVLFGRKGGGMGEGRGISMEEG